MAKIISCAIQKGGSGKTTTTVNLSAGLVSKGYSVLMVDVDPQGNLSQSFGIYEPEHTINGAFSNEYELPIIEIRNKLSLVPANIDLAESEMKLITMMQREVVLKKLLEPHRDKYDFIIIDCPPSIGILTINALAASDYVLIPLQAQYLAATGFKKLYELIEFIKDGLNSNLNVAGVFLTQYDPHKILNRSAKEMIEDQFGEKAYRSFIRNNIALAEAPSQGMDIFSYAPESNGAKDYEALIEEFLEREKIATHG
jgi:chromosome partitioning protein